MFATIRSFILPQIASSIRISNIGVCIPICCFSGHSHWATIKHDKADKDIKKSNIFAKLSRCIISAVQTGGNDPSINIQLEAAISAAKAVSMPKENIERAMNGKNLDAKKLINVTYEGFGPGKCAIIVECLTDNKNRTVSEIRHLFSKGMGNLGSIGCASRLFNYVGAITLSGRYTTDSVFDLAIEAGADDVFENEEDHTIVVECKPNQLHAVNDVFTKESMESKVELMYKPLEFVRVEEPLKQENIVWLLQQLDDHPDVQSVFHNLELCVCFNISLFGFIIKGNACYTE